MSSQLFAITGITGHVGGHAADALLKAGHRVRGVVRDETSDSSKALKAKGVELAVATFTDSAALTKAFAGVDGVFVMTPPLMSSPEPRKENKEYADNIAQAVLAAKVPRVVLLSSFGAQLSDPTINGPIIKCYDLEQVFFPLVAKGVAVRSLRAGYFAENTLGAIAYANATSTFTSLLPLDVILPVVSTKDIGIQAATLIADKSTGLRIVEFEGPKRIDYTEISNIFFKLSGKTLPVAVLPNEAREQVIKGFGASPASITSFIAMLDGSTNGTLNFEGTHETVKGTQTYEEFLTEFFAAQKKQ